MRTFNPREDYMRYSLPKVTRSVAKKLMREGKAYMWGKHTIEKKDKVLASELFKIETERQLKELLNNGRQVKNQLPSFSMPQELR